MHGVAAEVAQEVLVLFQHHHGHAGTRQQEAEHHPGRPAARNAAPGCDLFGWHDVAILGLDSSLPEDRR